MSATPHPGAPSIRFLTVAEVKGLHAAQIIRHGGDPGVANESLLVSGVAQAEVGFGGQFAHDFPFGMAATYLFHLVSNHPFCDGNKRIGLAAALSFLELNGYELIAGEDETYALTMGVAEGRVEKVEVERFLRDHSRPTA